MYGISSKISSELLKILTIRIALDVLESYKTMGSGYTGIMSDVLQYAVNNPSVLAAATK